MSDEQDKLKASLEPPRLFGRKKKSAAKGGAKPAKAAPPGVTETTPAPDDAVTELDEPDAPAVEETAPMDDEAPEPVEETIPAPAEDLEDESSDVTPDEPTSGADAEPTQDIESEPTVEPDATQVIDDEPAPELAGDATEDATASDQVDEDSAEEVPADEEPEEPTDQGPERPTPTRLTDRVRNRWGPKPAPVADEATEPTTLEHGQIELEPEPQPRPRPESESEPQADEAATSGTAYTEPMLAHYPAAALTGAIVGLAMVVLTWLSLRGCEAIRDTATCGGGPGFLLLLAVFIVSVMLGNAILKSFQVPDPGSSSFLAVGLVAVVALLLLIDALDSWVMLIAIPVISIGAYLLSVYVTKTFVEPANDS